MRSAIFLSAMIKCPICEGKGGWTEDFGEGTVVKEPCDYCHEKGKIGILEYVMYQIFQYEFLWAVWEWLFPDEF